MFLMGVFKKTHSFFTYLSLSYLAVYAVCALLLYLITAHVISESARAFDQDDIRSDSLEYAEILRDNTSGNWLAEEVALEHLPASTIFAIRLLGSDGNVVYSASQPTNFSFPGGWDIRKAPASNLIPKDGWREIYLPAYRRHLQLRSTRLPDGRVLQVAKSTARENTQEGILLRTSSAFFLLACLFTLGNGLWMMAITLRPIKRVTADMSKIIETGTCEAGEFPVSSRISELNTLGRYFDLMVQKNATLIKAMKDTLDNVAHDFRTPLARIRSAAEFALNAREPPLSHDALLGMLAGIVEDCDNAKLQLQNLMDIRAMESGFLNLDRQRFDLVKTVAEIADLYAVLAEDKNIALNIDVPEGQLSVDGDPLRLSQALANLIDNAVKYTPRDGNIQITLERAHGEALLTIDDTGIGIPEEDHALIGQRLFRSRNARSEKGLGLGMSIVKAIVDAHGGSVTFTSTPGTGSRFVVRLPAC